MTKNNLLLITFIIIINSCAAVETSNLPESLTVIPEVNENQKFIDYLDSDCCLLYTSDAADE